MKNIEEYIKTEDYETLRRSCFIQIEPGNYHAVYGKIIDTQQSGMRVVITRVVLVPGLGGYVPKIGEFHYYPLSKTRYRHVTEEEALGESQYGYRRREDYE